MKISKSKQKALVWKNRLMWWSKFSLFLMNKKIQKSNKTHKIIANYKMMIIS